MRHCVRRFVHRWRRFRQGHLDISIMGCPTCEDHCPHCDLANHCCDIDEVNWLAYANPREARQGVAQPLLARHLSRVVESGQWECHTMNAPRDPRDLLPPFLEAVLS